VGAGCVSGPLVTPSGSAHENTNVLPVIHFVIRIKVIFSHSENIMFYGFIASLGKRVHAIFGGGGVTSSLGTNSLRYKFFFNYTILNTLQCLTKSTLFSDVIKGSL
jgi:hypothetical protein